MFKQRYNYEYLQQFCQENIIELECDYSKDKITRDTIIIGKCKSEGCDKVFEKNTHIIADVEKADPQYFKNPKYKTPDDVLHKKKKTCMSHFCNTIERHLQEVCIKYLINAKFI